MSDDYTPPPTDFGLDNQNSTIRRRDVHHPKERQVLFA